MFARTHKFHQLFNTRGRSGLTNRDPLHLPTHCVSFRKNPTHQTGPWKSCTFSNSSVFGVSVSFIASLLSSAFLIEIRAKLPAAHVARPLQPGSRFFLNGAGGIHAPHDAQRVHEVCDGGVLPVPRLPQVQDVLRRARLRSEVIDVSEGENTQSRNRSSPFGQKS